MQKPPPLIDSSVEAKGADGSLLHWEEPLIGLVVEDESHAVICSGNIQMLAPDTPVDPEYLLDFWNPFTDIPKNNFTSYYHVYLIYP